MSVCLIINIKQLVNVRQESKLLRGSALADLPFINNAFLLIEEGIITNYGAMFELETHVPHLPKNIIDAQGQLVLPCWCDSHTHLVFTGSREDEMVDKIKGLSYSDIAARGGGILNSARKINEIN